MQEKLEPAIRVVALASSIILVAVLTFVPPSSNDFWLQARIGQLIVETRAIPHTVLFPFTEAQHSVFNAHEWLPSIFFHLLDRSVGEDKLVLVLGLFGLILFALSAGLAWRMTHSLGASLVLGLWAMTIGNFRHLLRPELIAVALFLLLLHVLLTYQKSRRWSSLLWTQLIAVTWANSHASFLLGLTVAAIFAVGEGLQGFLDARAEGWRIALRVAAKLALPYAIASVGMALVSLANPLGLDLFHFTLALSMSDVTKAIIKEWTPTLAQPFISTPPFFAFMIAIGLVAALVLSNWRRVRIADVLLLLVFAALAFQRNRFVMLFGFATIPACARAIGSLPPAPVERRLLILTGTLASIGIALALKFGNMHGAYPFFAPSNHFSELMLIKLSEPDIRGNVFNSYELGAELIHRAWPRLRPSIDSRIDSYGDEYFLDHYRMLRDEQRLSQFIEQYDVRYMLLLWRDFEVIKTMQSLRQGGWRMEFADHKMVLLHKPDSQSRRQSRAGLKP